MAWARPGRSATATTRSSPAAATRIPPSRRRWSCSAACSSARSSDIAEIVVETGPGGQALTTVEPETVLAAKFSIPHAIAATARLGTAGARAFTFDTLRRRRHREAAASACASRPTADLQPWPKDRPARVTLRFQDGGEMSAVCESARGGADQPFDEPTLLSKLAENAAGVFPAAPARSWPASSAAMRALARPVVARSRGRSGEDMTLARELVARAAAAAQAPLPEDVALAARLHLLDASASASLPPDRRSARPIAILRRTSRAAGLPLCSGRPQAPPPPTPRSSTAA